MPDDAVTHRIEVAPRPSPLHLVSVRQADEFLADGDFGLSVGEGHFPARVIQRVTGSPYVHTIGIYRAAGRWRVCESVPPRVRTGFLDDLVAENSGLYDFYRLAPGLCDLEKAWRWACTAEGTLYSVYDLWLVWRRRYRKAKAEGKCGEVAFPSLRRIAGRDLNPEGIDIEMAVTREAIYDPDNTRVPDPKPNSDIPDGCRRDCSSLWGAACRVAGLTPPLQPFDCDTVPGDFSVAPMFLYVCTLVK